MLEANKTLVRRYYENATGDLSQTESIVTDDFVDHHFPDSLPEGPEGVRTFFKDILGGIFGNMRIEYDEMIAEGDKVVCRFALRATHENEFAGIPGSGKEILCPAVSTFRVADGKLAEAWEIADIAGLLEQMKA